MEQMINKVTGFIAGVGCILFIIGCAFGLIAHLLGYGG
jgi:hypothetical protein